MRHTQQTLAQPSAAASHKPWPWADTWPVARLQWITESEIAKVLEVQSDYYVLSGAHGSAHGVEKIGRILIAQYSAACLCQRIELLT